jgi:hypothetical protein
VALGAGRQGAHGETSLENPIVVAKSGEMGLVLLTLCFTRLFFILC